VAVIGMLLVARRHGQRGVGRRLTQHALSHSPAMTVFLYATPQGMPLYERMDFQVLDTSRFPWGAPGPRSAPLLLPTVRRCCDSTGSSSAPTAGRS
jgi:predicted N-acetyltransferase YhbS